MGADMEVDDVGDIRDLGGDNDAFDGLFKYREKTLDDGIRPIPVVPGGMTDGEAG